MILKNTNFENCNIKIVNINWKYFFDRNFMFLNPRQNMIVRDYVVLISFSKILQNCNRIFGSCFPFY